MTLILQFLPAWINKFWQHLPPSYIIIFTRIILNKETSVSVFINHNFGQIIRTYLNFDGGVLEIYLDHKFQ